MVDTRWIKGQTDLRRLVEADLGPPKRHGGGAALYKCPFHRERSGFSLAVWPDGYRCFGKCDTAGDALDWLVQYRGLLFTDALKVLESGHVGTQVKRDSGEAARGESEPPGPDWQRAARRVVKDAERALWSTEGKPALDYLLKRGLTKTTIRNAHLGYVPGDYRAWQEVAGLNVPCGITIPWFASGALWALKVRRAAGQPKYVQVAGGSSGGLFNGDALQGADVAVLVEGEFDALLLAQAAGDLLAPVTLGSATARLPARWAAAMVTHRAVFVAYDNDQAGQQAAGRLAGDSARFKRLPVPQGKDVSEYAELGGDLRAWINETMSTCCNEREGG